MGQFEFNRRISSPLFFTCEHASDIIPLEYNNLGLTVNEAISSKDLYDPGSLDLAIGLADIFKASLIYPKFSRLLIDANRILGVASNANNTYHAAALKTELLIEDEKGERLILIPKNQVANLQVEEKYRWDKYVKPYYDEIEKLSEQLLNKYKQIYIFQIHSFYPKYNGDIRKIDIGVVHNEISSARKIISFLRKNTDFNIGNNKPWGMSAVSGGILKPLQKREGIDIIAFDVNNKHLKNNKDINIVKNILRDAIKNVI